MGWLLRFSLAPPASLSWASSSESGPSHGFGTLKEEQLAILAATVIAVGAQIFFTSFLLSIIGLRRRRDEP